MVRHAGALRCSQTKTRVVLMTSLLTSGVGRAKAVRGLPLQWFPPHNACMVTPRQPSAEEELKHLRWAISVRAKIQETLLALYELVLQGPARGHPSWWEELLKSYFLGTGFALWRAAFLADKARDVESTVTAQEAFLKQLLSTNAITFGDDRTNRSWTVTFYLEDAKLQNRGSVSILRPSSNRRPTTGDGPARSHSLCTPHGPPAR